VIRDDDDSTCDCPMPRRDGTPPKLVSERPRSTMGLGGREPSANAGRVVTGALSTSLAVDATNDVRSALRPAPAHVQRCANSRVAKLLVVGLPKVGRTPALAPVPGQNSRRRAPSLPDGGDPQRSPPPQWASLRRRGGHREALGHRCVVHRVGDQRRYSPDRGR